ncbi:MAG: rhomboid family intramembrane serine protease [Sandaracinaceae bacterium]|nr:rhomboid family intramembrane serine protease [Sandaracinaceae bacterium]
MFIVVPIGHDQPVYDRPWLTLGTIAVCTCVFLVSWAVEISAMSEITAAAAEVDAVASRYPGARVSFAVSGLSGQLSAAIGSLVDESPERAARPGDAELEAAMLRLVRGLNRLPALRFGYRPGAPTVSGVLGHAFMHADVFHLAGNMLFLWVAGGVLECFWRRWAFVLLYVVSAAAGTLAHHLCAPSSLIPLVGASGAIAGLIGAYIVCYPRSRIRLGYFVLLFFRPFWGTWKVPALVVIPLWALTELAYALWGAQDGVAYWAHVGGFAIGIAAGILARALGLVALDAGQE